MDRLIDPEDQMRDPGDQTGDPGDRDDPGDQMILGIRWVILGIKVILGIRWVILGIEVSLLIVEIVEKLGCACEIHSRRWPASTARNERVGDELIEEINRIITD